MAVARGPSPAAVPGSPKASYSPLAYGRRQPGPSSKPENAEEDAEEDELSDLLNLALTKTPSRESESALSNSMNLDMDSSLELGKTETSDSSTFTNLLNTLHGSYHVGLQPQAQHLACTNWPASMGAGMGAGGFGIRLPGSIVSQPSMLAEDSESDDLPLVSKRAAGCRTSNIIDVAADVAVDEVPVVASHLSNCSIEQQEQQQVECSALLGVSGLGGVADAASGSLGGVGGVVSLLATARSSSPLSCFRPHPAWPAQASRLLYVAVFLTQESRDVLLSMVPPLHPLVSADHMTLAYKPLNVQQLLSFPLGASVQLSITGSTADSRVQAVAAEPPPWLLPTPSVAAHITISVALGSKAAEAGVLVRDALQLAAAAAAEPAGPVVSGAGTLQRFGEPLQLLGRLGVRLALPCGQAVVVHSVEELAAGGHVCLCSDTVDAFYAMHSKRLQKPLQQQPSPTSCLDLPAATGGEVLLQGYVREFACEEAFQGNGVMVVLTDNTIGFVVAVLDPASSGCGGAGSSGSSKRAAAQAKASKPNKRKQKAARKKPAVQGGQLAALDAAASDAADVLSEWAMSQHDAAQGGVAATAAGGLGARNAADAARDMQLWAEFDALQRQHGEELCSAILRSCNHDFVEAVATIKAQAAGFGSGAAAAAPAAAAVPTAGATAAVQQPAAAAAAAGPDDELVVQLALSLGLPAESALALCRLVPHVAPEAAVEALQQHSGDANKAANALLAAEAEVESAAAAAAIAAADDSISSTAASAEAAVCGGSSSSRRSPAERVAASFVRGRDADLVVAARGLCGMFDGLQQELAELVLQEHGGSIEEAAQAISDMQAKELQARTAAAAADAAGSPRMQPQQQQQQQQQGQQQLSEEDQLAMLTAMGLFDAAEQQQQQAKNRGSSAGQRQLRSPPKSPQPSSPLSAPTQHQQPHYSDQQHTSRPHSSSYSPLSFNNRQPPPPPPPQQQQQGSYGSPGRYSSMRQQQQQAAAASQADQEAKLMAKAAADKLYTKSRTLSQGATVLLTAASALLAEGNDAGYREKKAAADKLRAESLAAFDEAQRLSWSANNTAQQAWQVDLHGLGTSVALRKFVAQFSGLEAMAAGHPGGVLYSVITGKGKHSTDNVPKIKLGVLQYLQERAEAVLQQTGRPWAVLWQVDPSNEGLVNVYIPGCSEEEGHEGGSAA
ncbi:hypothetical protein OEZ85_009050 [Tetradesmus obliquus]|uniref:Smr domain-containing protein n=1 Tax=Tetradesmus obliquus TaxID=3088 RepID=A0ABY8TL79_TETOB|nr:hypothetical protein OEZ85_009050 [Tetradesmus obliquus]